MHNQVAPTDPTPTLREIQYVYEDNTEIMKEALLTAKVGVANANQERAAVMDATQQEATIAGHTVHHNCVDAQLYAAMVYLLQAGKDTTGKERRRNTRLAFAAIVQARKDVSWARRYLFGPKAEAQT